MRKFAELDETGLYMTSGEGPSQGWQPPLAHWAWIPAGLPVGAGWRWTGHRWDPPEPATWGIQDYVQAVQTALDSWARARNYDGILSLTTYATDPDPAFRAEGQAGVDARSRAWRHAYAYLAAVQAGRRPLISPAALVAELPPMVWP